MSATVPLRSSNVENVLVEGGAGIRVPKLDKVSGMKEDKTMKLEKEVCCSSSSWCYDCG
jgi:hypothetical protein